MNFEDELGNQIDLMTYGQWGPGKKQVLVNFIRSLLYRTHGYVLPLKGETQEEAKARKAQNTRE